MVYSAARWGRIPEVQVRIPSRAMGTFSPHNVSSFFRLSLTHTHTPTRTHAQTRTCVHTHSTGARCTITPDVRKTASSRRWRLLKRLNVLFDCLLHVLLFALYWPLGPTVIHRSLLLSRFRSRIRETVTCVDLVDSLSSR